jgi:uncharacterized protein
MFPLFPAAPAALLADHAQPGRPCKCFAQLRDGAAHEMVAGEENKDRNMAFFHHGMIRGNQDVISNLVWGRVFERFPRLKLACAEADAGCARHFMHRMNHFYRRHGCPSNLGEMAKLPDDYVWFTFQDDAIAMNSFDMLNPSGSAASPSR